MLAASIEKVSKLSLGAIHDWAVSDHWKLGLGASYDFDIVPLMLKASYGSDPHGAMVFSRIIAN